MKEHKLIELVSMDQAMSVAKKDKSSVSTMDEYVSENTLSYYILINTWGLILKQFAPHVYARVLDKILSKGLIPVIKEMQDEATRIVNEEELGPWATLLYRDVERMPRVSPLGEYSQIDRPLLMDWNLALPYNEDAVVLFLLRYPKRFSPSSNNLIKEETLKDFKAMENRSKMMQRSESFAYAWLVPYVRDAIANLYDWDAICDEIEDITVDDWELSSGSATDASPTLGAKVTTLLEDGNLDCVKPIMGVYTLTRYPVHREDPHISRVVAVPKSYKASRIIAMEPVRYNAFGKAVEKIFRKYDRQRKEKYPNDWLNRINLEDQRENQMWAQIGCSTGHVATMDASHASDLITKTHLFDLFPKRYTNLVAWCLPTQYSIEKDSYPMLQMASTSGHTLTFRHETIVYQAIAHAAFLMAERFAKACPSTEDPRDDIFEPVAWAYGDDVVIARPAYEVACYFYKRLGLIINDDKSFYSRETGSFRESCGRDYFRRNDVTSLYYPRFPVIGSVSKGNIKLSSKTYRDEYRGKLENSLTMLIDLQKKLFPVCYDASRLVTSIVRNAYPTITTSIAGEVCNDLWDYVDSGKPSVPAAYEIEKVGDRVVPRVENFRWKRLPHPSTTLSGSARSVFDRAVALDTKHVYPAVRYNSKNSFTPKEVAVYEYWKYINFLRFGPRFNNELDRLLGVTTPQMSISEFYGKATLALVTK